MSAYGARDHDAFEFPISSKHKMLETLTVFDDVFVPWERVFLCREPERAGAISNSFVEYHRFTAVSYKLPLLDALIGTAALIAEMNGVAKAGHIRDKLTRLDHLRRDGAGAHRHGRAAGARRRARHRRTPTRSPPTWRSTPSPRTTTTALELVQDCAGGLLVTGPGGADWANPEVRAVLEKFYAAKAPAEERLRLMNTISDLTARDFGGYHAVLAVHAEGSIEAEKLQIYRAYEPGRALAYARRSPRSTDRRSSTERADASEGEGDQATRGVRGSHGSAVALGVAGDTPDGHVDAVPGGGALLFGLATPEAVLAVLTCPLTARREDGAVGADGAGLGLAHVAGLGPLAGGSEEEVVLALDTLRCRSR